MTFFGPDFVPFCSQAKFWVRYIENHVPNHARAQNLAQIGAFWSQDTFKALKMGKKCTKRPKIAISLNFEGINELKIIDKPTFPKYMNPYSPISWLYVYGFLGQN